MELDGRLAERVVVSLFKDGVPKLLHRDNIRIKNPLVRYVYVEYLTPELKEPAPLGWLDMRVICARMSEWLDVEKHVIADDDAPWCAFKQEGGMWSMHSSWHPFIYKERNLPGGMEHTQQEMGEGLYNLRGVLDKFPSRHAWTPALSEDPYRDLALPTLAAVRADLLAHKLVNLAATRRQHIGERDVCEAWVAARRNLLIQRTHMFYPLEDALVELGAPKVVTVKEMCEEEKKYLVAWFPWCQAWVVEGWFDKPCYGTNRRARRGRGLVYPGDPVWMPLYWCRKNLPDFVGDGPLMYTPAERWVEAALQELADEIFHIRKGIVSGENWKEDERIVPHLNYASKRILRAPIYSPLAAGTTLAEIKAPCIRKLCNTPVLGYNARKIFYRILSNVHPMPPFETIVNRDALVKHYRSTGRNPDAEIKKLAQEYKWATSRQLAPVKCRTLVSEKLCVHCDKKDPVRACFGADNVRDIEDIVFKATPLNRGDFVGLKRKRD